MQKYLGGLNNSYQQAALIQQYTMKAILSISIPFNFHKNKKYAFIFKYISPKTNVASRQANKKVIETTLVLYKFSSSLVGFEEVGNIKDFSADMAISPTTIAISGKSSSKSLSDIYFILSDRI